ncbi:hypothetical protein [Saccharopolyspora sp. NPDC049426]|uniref:hypothetical protein n=1 Tax=Saccharopolyspora sp. NPDC049426 TaxID=3155652 RepID=UPI003433B87B
MADRHEPAGARSARSLSSPTTQPRTVRHHQLELADAVREAELATGIDGDALWRDLAAEEEQDPEIKALAIQAMSSEVPQLSPAQHQALRRFLQKAVAAQTRPA